MRPLKKELILLTRTLHIYLTMLALLLLFFFSISGFAMNHENWFQLNQARITDRTLSLPADVAASTDKLKVVEYLRKTDGVSGEVASFEQQDDQTTVQFAAPGRTTEFTITRPTGDTQVHEELRNLLALMADLHRGKHTGPWWKWIIDAAAVSLFLASLTGLILFFTLPKRRKLGLIALGAGIIACVAIYAWLVP